MAHKQLTVEMVSQAIIDAKGIVSVAADRLGCHRQTVYDYMERHPACRAAQDQAQETVTDFFETKLIQKANQGDIRAITFYLETKGKKRGYVKRSELSGPDGASIPNDITITFDR